MGGGRNTFFSLTAETHYLFAMLPPWKLCEHKQQQEQPKQHKTDSNLQEGDKMLSQSTKTYKKKNEEPAQARLEKFERAQQRGGALE